MTYNFCDNNSPETPARYDYSKYYGKEFLGDFFSVRERFFNKLIPLIGDQYAFLKFTSSREVMVEILKKEFLYKITDDETAGYSEIFYLSKALENILSKILSDKETNLSRIYFFMSTFIKKYEVFKRLYATYDPSFKKASDDFTSLYHYCLLSAAALLYFLKYDNLKFLNVALKLNDMLCGQIARMNQKEALIFACLLSLEQESIHQIMQNKNIKL